MRKLIVLLAIATLFNVEQRSANADSNKQIERINVRAYRNVMRTNYPSPLAQHFRLFAGDMRQFVNTNVLTKENADLGRDALLKALLADAADSNNMSTAQRAAVVDPDLRATRAKTESILNELKIPIPSPIANDTQTPQTPTPPSNKDYKQFDEAVE